MAEPVSKRQRTNAQPVLAAIRNAQISSAHLGDGARAIGTHHGNFHCDEALACAMLKMLPDYEGEEVIIVRTRDSAVLEHCHTVVDVGAVYDHAARRYDHHQRTFDGVLDGYSTKLSSAGLIYKHYGREVIARLTRDIEGAGTELTEVLYHKVYRNFVEHIDGIDNGVESHKGEENYKVTTTLSARVGKLNPAWNEPQTDEIANANFREAMLLTGNEFLDCVEGLAKSWWPARSIVAEALASRHKVHPSGRVALLPRFCPWSSHLFELEATVGSHGEKEEDKIDKSNNILYVLFQDSKGGWRIQAVPAAEGSFDCRKKLPAAWRGLRDDELSRESGIEGGVFVHAAGFIGGNKTREGTLAMAAKAVEVEV